jgi:hypothetical protein
MMIPARLPGADWWLTQSKMLLMNHLTRPSESTQRALWDLCQQYREAVQGGAVRPLQVMP